MLFHVTHTHTWDACPYNQPDKVRATFGAAFAGVAATGATLVGAWVDAPAHKVFLVIEADSARQIEEALAPIIPVGTAETRPVVDAAELIARRASSE